MRVRAAGGGGDRTGAQHSTVGRPVHVGRRLHARTWATDVHLRAKIFRLQAQKMRFWILAIVVDARQGPPIQTAPFFVAAAVVAITTGYH